MLLEPGTRVGPYQIAGSLGGGGMGEVYEARDTRLGRKVALKTLRHESLAEPEARRRFEREARALSALSHPGICTVFDVGQHDGIDYIVMELVDGETLSATFERTAIDERTLVGYAARIADALAEAHEQGVLHRDVKPQNVMITRRGAKLLDFGLARPMASAVGGEPMTVTAVTAVDAIAGTVPYMSPEQARGEALDGRSDTFSLGVVMYEALTGRRPFGGSGTAETLAAILHEEPVPLARFAPHTSAELQRIVHKCLRKDRTQRYQTARDLANDLEALQQRSGQTPAIGTAAPPAPARSARRVRLATGGAALAIVALGVSWWLSAASRRESTPWTLQGRSVAILPLKPLSQKVDENYFGLGIADAVITRLSASSDIKVRPTSAVRRFVSDDLDALGAGAQLGVDAVLEGTWQRVGDRVRLTLNLLRVETGDSLWTNRFDVPVGDVLAIQDRVSSQLGDSLQLALNSGDRSSGLRGTTVAEAYDLYLKAAFYLGDRGYNPPERANSDRAIELLEQAVALDPRYAEAYAMLGFALAHTAIFMEDNPALIARARTAIATAEALSPALAYVHLTRALILWSWYDGWRLVDSIREYRRTLALDPAWTDAEMLAGYAHLGFVDEWRHAAEQLIARDPTNRSLRAVYVEEHYLLNLAEEGRALQQKWLNEGPDARYYLLTGRLAEAAPLVEARVDREPQQIHALANLAQLRALQGRHAEARTAARRLDQLLPRNRHRHHLTYALARVAALGGDAGETARRLKETIDWGFPCYPLFSTDTALDRVRQAPQVARVLADLKRDWEGYRRALAE